MKESVTIDELISFLNDLVAIDAHAIFALITTRTLCNKELADHPTVQAREFNHGGHDRGYEVGVLGLLNGVFGVDSDSWGPITAILNERGTRLIGFRRTAEQDVNKE